MQRRRCVAPFQKVVIIITYTLRSHGENYSVVSRCHVISCLQGKEDKVYQFGEFLSKRAGRLF